MGRLGESSSLRLVPVILLLLTACEVAPGMDIGHHYDLTRSAMSRFGYSTGARDVASIGAWFVDFWAYFPVPGTNYQSYQLLHFDSLWSDDEIGSYFLQLSVNTRQLLSRLTDPAEYNLLLGLTLHAVADFHAHSTWGEESGPFRSRCDCFRSDSYFTNPGSGLISGDCTPICTLPELVERGGRNKPNHGVYCSGVNKDSYLRPWFEAAYVGAHQSATQWVANFERWADEAHPNGPGRILVERARAYQLVSSEAKQELEYLWKVPMFLKYPSGSADGHWKGCYSGNERALALQLPGVAALSYFLRSQANDLAVNLTKDLYAMRFLRASERTAHPAWPAVYGGVAEEGWFVVEVRILKYWVTVPLRYSNPYAMVSVSGVPSREPAMTMNATFSPYWKSLTFVPDSASVVPVRISLFDLNVIGADTPYDVNPGRNYSTLQFDFSLDTHRIASRDPSISQLLDGIHDSETSAVTIGGDGTSSRPAITIQFFVTSKPLTPSCSSTSRVSCPEPEPPAFC